MEAARSVIGVESGEQRGQRRSIHLDNAKAILIALVVFGQLLELGLLGTRAGTFVYLFIFLFHMPAFAFVSGVLSRPDAYTLSGARKLLSLAGVYVFFQCAYIAMQHFRTGEFSYYEAVVYPTWVLWFLVSLISWRLMLPLFARGRSYRAAFVSIAVAVVLAVASGLLLVDGGLFSLSQTFVFLPFFVTGFWATRLSVRIPGDRRMLVLAVVVFVAAAVVLAWDDTLVRAGWLYGRATFSQIGGSVWEDGFKRLLLLASSGVLVAAFMRLVPRRPTAFSRLGKTTLSVYVWHGLAIWMVSAVGLEAVVGGSFLGVALATVAMLVVFGVGPIAAITLRLTGSSAGGPTIDRATRRDHLLGVAIVSAFTASLIGKAYLTRLLVAHDSSVLRAMALEGPLLFVLVAGVYVLTRRVRWLTVIALSATAIVLSITMAATAIYAAYFGQVLTPETVMLAREATEVGPSITDLLRPAHLLYAVDVPLMVLAAILISRTRSDERSLQVRPATARLAVVTVCALLIASVPMLSAWWLPENVDSVVAARKRGVLAYQLLGLPALAEATPADVLVDQAYSDDLISKIERLRGEDAGPRIAAFRPGAYRGKNLIVVQMESVQSYLVDLKVDGVEVMPHLDRLASESWYFPRTYAQIGRGNTSDAEFVMNTGLYPPINQAASVRWAAKTLPSLPRLLGAQGYRTATMHANTARFWNRTELYPALGFDEYYDREAIGEPEWGWGASDEVTFDFALSLMKGLRTGGEPFYAQIVTLTSHVPYDYPPAEQRPYTPSAAFAGTKVGAYLSSQSYADKTIGKFVEDLKECGLWDESIVVFYGDHPGLRRPVSEADEYQAPIESLIGHSYTDIDFLCVPLIIHFPAQTRGYVVDETLGQVDILPTLSDPLGIDLSGFPNFGRSAFVSGDEVIGMRGLVTSGSMLNGDVLFQPGIGFEDGAAVDVRTGAPLKAGVAVRQDYEVMTELLRLAAEYTDGLPVRRGANGSLDDGALVPGRDTAPLDMPDQ